MYTISQSLSDLSIHHLLRQTAIKNKRADLAMSLSGKLWFICPVKAKSVRDRLTAIVGSV